jgi:hypothetical protein
MRETFSTPLRRVTSATGQNVRQTLVRRTVLRILDSSARESRYSMHGNFLVHRDPWHKGVFSRVCEPSGLHLALGRFRHCGHQAVRILRI